MYLYVLYVYTLCVYTVQHLQLKHFTEWKNCEEKRELKKKKHNQKDQYNYKQPNIETVISQSMKYPGKFQLSNQSSKVLVHNIRYD